MALRKAWQEEDRGESITKPEILCSFFWCKPKYRVGVVLTLSRDGSALGRLGVGVQVLSRLGIGAWTKVTPSPLPTQYYTKLLGKTLAQHCTLWV